jgi:hypothetical protein
MIDSKLILILLVTISTTLAELNGKCQGRNGICIKTSECQSYGGTTYSGYCPIDPPDVLCCDDIKCPKTSNTGKCLFTDQCPGERADGLCPGGSNFKCCLNGDPYCKHPTKSQLDAHIGMAYHYAHKNCIYKGGPGSFPPMSQGYTDCVTLAFRAFYTLGCIKDGSDLVIERACERAGLIYSTDENDVWRHHGVVFMENNGGKGWSHVYYSLGGTDKEHISKYDLGNDDRIEKTQPFSPVPINQWPNRHFLKMYYVKE